MLIRVGAAVAAFVVGAAAQDAPLEHFETRVRPVLAAHCYACHSESAAAPQGGLLLDSTRGIQQGGKSGAVIQPGDPENSLLLRAIRYQNKNLKMPPGEPLAGETVADIEAWIRAGAPLPVDQEKAAKARPALWSLQKPGLPQPPAVRDPKRVRNDVDRFVLSRLEVQGLAPSPEAAKETLIRRATYDLTGLPPTAEEVEQFARDSSPQAYERLIDHLLASPRYGERWGRHWLDVARYADSVNDSVNAGQRYAWSYTYRDWVIAALNEDLPYDQFVLYQLAADRLKDVDSRHLAALGFLSLGRDFPKSYPETVDDRIDATARGFLGLTVACARCHDHKYDPIPTRDYYSLYSILSNIREPEELPLLGKPGALSRQQALYQERLARIQQADHEYRVHRNAEMMEFFKSQTAEYLVAARDAAVLSNPEIEELVRDRQLNLHMLARWRKYLAKSKESGDPVFVPWHAAAAIPDQDFAEKWPGLRGVVKGNSLLDAAVAAKSVTSLRDLAEAYAAVLKKYDQAEPFGELAAEQLRAVVRGPASAVDVPLEEFELIYTEGDSNNTRSLRVRYNNMLAQAAYDGAQPRAMAVEDMPDPVPVHVFVRGNPNNPGDLAPPRFPTCLGGSDSKTFQNGSGRLELAHAIIDPENPLTARVIVNRVWMHHFGFGLVRTPSDFGVRGDTPTHPELLDYLAVKFVQSGWSLKKLHRLIMNSAAYRQASADNEAARQVDPENQLLWRMNRRRLEIESVRDSMLAAAGRLDPAAAGDVPFSLTAQPSVPRRSVYGFIERGRVPSILSAFDFASPDQHAPMRFVTTVPQQALFFLNSPFVAEQARHLVARPEVAAAGTSAGKIQQLYRFLFGRAPAPRELDAGLGFVSQGAAEALPERPVSPWQWGVGTYRADSGTLESFEPFPVFVPDQWQGGAALPAGRFGKAALRAAGGEPGEHANQAVIRRWVSPVKGKLSIEGTLRHGQPAVPYGDGVRGRIVSSRHGEIASWNVNGSSAETRLSGIEVEEGDTIAFVVDARDDPENDAFGWAPLIKMGEQIWDAKNDFSGPSPEPLNVWERYAQVLFETNEFAFVD
jgi:hypothetical protein